MHIWVCPTCGANYPPGPEPPVHCLLCEDERQWVPPTGQVWRTMDELVESGYCSEVREVEPDLVGIAVRPGIGVGQRALLVRTSEGNLLWDPPAFIDDAAIDGRWAGRAGRGQLEPSAHVRRDRRVEPRLRRRDPPARGGSAMADAP